MGGGGNYFQQPKSWLRLSCVKGWFINFWALTSFFALAMRELMSAIFFKGCVCICEVGRYQELAPAAKTVPKNRGKKKNFANLKFRLCHNCAFGTHFLYAIRNHKKSEKPFK